MRVMAGSVVVAAALVVAGCSSEEGAPSPTTSASSSATSPVSSSTPPEPSATTSDAALPPLPELPAAATTADAAGAEAFVRHFWDVVNYAYATGDTDPVLAISDEGCGACTSLVANVQSVTDEGSTWVGMEWQTSDYLSSDPNGDGRSLVSGLLMPKQGAYVSTANGDEEPVDLEEPSDFQILTSWTGESWTLYAISSFADGSAR